MFVYLHIFILIFFFFFNDTATTEIYTLSLHDALPICLALRVVQAVEDAVRRHPPTTILRRDQRRTSGPPPRTSSTSRGVTSAMSPHIEHLRAPTAVPTSTASWSSRFWSTAQRNPAT